MDSNNNNTFPLPTEQQPFMASNHSRQRGAAPPRGGHSEMENGPSNNHGYVPNHRTGNRHDWAAYANYGHNNMFHGHGQFPHPPYPYGYHHPNHNHPHEPVPFPRNQARYDMMDRNSASLDEIPSPPRAGPRQYHERMDYHPEMMMAPEAYGQVYPPQYLQHRHDDRSKGQSHSTLVTPLRSPKSTDASKENISATKPPPRKGSNIKSSPNALTRTKAAAVASSSKVIWELGEYDVLCGRGAPTNFHSGNRFLRKLVAEYQTLYLCSKRSDKPAIAWKLLDIVTSRGGRFVKRNKAHKNTTFAWEPLNEKQAYEKICQALREGAPELRRRMLKDMDGIGKFHELEDEEEVSAEEADEKEKEDEYKGEKSDSNEKETKTPSVRTRSAAAKGESADDVYEI